MRQAAALLLVACALAYIGAAQARIEDVTLDKDDRSVIVVSTPFGFSEDGVVDVLVSKLLVWKPSDAADVDLEQLGFFLAPSESETQMQMEIADGSCVLGDSLNYVQLFTLKQVRETQSAEQARTGGEAAFMAKFLLSELKPELKGGELSLYYAKCALDDYAVSITVTTTMYNLKGDDRYDYLSMGEDALPLMYMTLFVLFAICAAMWTVTLLRGRQATHRVHWLMLLLIAFKALTLLSQAGMYHMISKYGRPEGWNILFYIFTFLRGTLFFTLVVLIGTGWSYMKPFIAQREKRILLAVLPLQVIANVAIVVLDETTPAERSWFRWRDLLHLVDIVCCCAVLFPIVWSIKHLRDASQTDGKAARCLVKLQLFRSFYVIVVSYIYFTRIVVFLLRSTMPYSYSWLSEATSELATLAFYVVVGVQFRPKTDNPYLQLSNEDMDADMEMSRIKMDSQNRFDD